MFPARHNAPPGIGADIEVARLSPSQTGRASYSWALCIPAALRVLCGCPGPDKVSTDVSQSWSLSLEEHVQSNGRSPRADDPYGRSILDGDRHSSAYLAPSQAYADQRTLRRGLVCYLGVDASHLYSLRAQ